MEEGGEEQICILTAKASSMTDKKGGVASCVGGAVWVCVSACCGIIVESFLPSSFLTPSFLTLHLSALLSREVEGTMRHREWEDEGVRE